MCVSVDTYPVVFHLIALFFLSSIQQAIFHAPAYPDIGVRKSGNGFTLQGIPALYAKVSRVIADSSIGHNVGQH